MRRLILGVGVLGACSSIGLAQCPGTTQAFASPAYDVWEYPAAGSGASLSAPTFGSPLATEDPDRLGYCFAAFRTQDLIPTASGPFQVRSATLTVYVLNSSRPSPNTTIYDPTYDSWRTYLGIDPDADAGRPIELYGCLFNNGLTLGTWNEATTPVFQNGLYNVLPADFPTSTLVPPQPRDVTSNVDGPDFTVVGDGFDARPLAIGTTSQTYVGSDGNIHISDGATLTFQIDVTDPRVRAYLERSLRGDGYIGLVISSLHGAAYGGMGAGETYPRIATKEAFGLPDPSLSIEYVALPRFDVNADTRVDVDDLYTWHHGTGNRDVDQSGAVDGADVAALKCQLRSLEHATLLASRP